MKSVDCAWSGNRKLAVNDRFSRSLVVSGANRGSRHISLQVANRKAAAEAVKTEKFSGAFRPRAKVIERANKSRSQPLKKPKADSVREVGNQLGIWSSFTGTSCIRCFGRRRILHYLRRDFHRMNPWHFLS